MSTADQNLNDQSKAPYRPIAVRYGLIAALVSIALGLVFYVFNLIDYADNSSPGNIASTVLNVVVIIVIFVLAIKTHRDQDLGGYITFGRAFGVAFLTGLVAALIGLVWTFAFFQFIDPSIQETIAEATRENMLNQGMSEEELQQAWGITSMFISPIALSLFGFVFSILGTVVLGLIVAAVMKRTKE